MSGRVSYSEVGGAIECQIKAWKQWPWIITWPFWILFWIAATSQTIHDPVGSKCGTGVSMYLSVGMWLSMGILFTYGWLWTMFGNHVISADRQRLQLQAGLVGMTWTRSFDASRIRNLRAQGPFGPANMWRVMFRTTMKNADMDKFNSRGAISFKYGRRTRRFGEKLTEEEANELIERRNVYLPASVFEDS